MTNFLYKNDLPDNLDLGRSIAIDTETMGLKAVRDRLCLVQISGGDGNAHLIQFEKGQFEKGQFEKGNYASPNLKKLLTNRNVLKIFHFARFDLLALRKNLEIEIHNIYCTKIASKLARTYTDAHGLKAISDELLGVELSKKQQSSDWGAEVISEDQIKYAASDVLYLHQIKEKLDLILKREGRFEIARKCFEFLPTRAELDLNGFEEEDIFRH